jgi:NTE family protein
MVADLHFSRLPVMMLSIRFCLFPFRMLLCLTLVMLIQGCASIYKPKNQPIAKIDNKEGYRFVTSRKGDMGDHMVFLAFSGGGTRAAALSYGLLKELRDTQVDSRGQRVRLLDEVDSISSVSGGSFTAAYYGLFGEKTFDDYEKVFLRQSIQGTLIRQLFNPAFWWDSVFDGFDRTEMAVDYYDRHIFEGKTFADINLKGGPFIEINATDLAGGNRFSFIQASFDLICSNLNDFTIARAVTASSAVPVAFPTVVLKNHAGKCDFSQSSMKKFMDTQSDNDPRKLEIKQRMQSYLDPNARPYIHLVDGGIADNLGLRAVADRIETQGSGYLTKEGARAPKDVLIITVNAQVKPSRTMDHSAEKPSVGETVDAMTDTQMSLFNDETKLHLQKKLGDLKTEFAAKGHDVIIHNVEISFDSVEAKTMKSMLNSLPTSLELSNKDVDILIETAAHILRRNPNYLEFLRSNNGTHVASVPAQVTATR